MNDAHDKLVITALTTAPTDVSENVFLPYKIGTASSSKAMRFLAAPSKLADFQPPSYLKVIAGNDDEILRNATEIHCSAWSQNPFCINAKLVPQSGEEIGIIIPNLIVESFNPHSSYRQLCLRQKYEDAELRLCFSIVNSGILFTAINCKVFSD